MKFSRIVFLYSGFCLTFFLNGMDDQPVEGALNAPPAVNAINPPNRTITDSPGITPNSIPRGWRQFKHRMECGVFKPGMNPPKTP